MTATTVFVSPETPPLSHRCAINHLAGGVAGATGLEPAASGVTGRRSNQLSYAPGKASIFGLSLRVRWDTTRIPPSQDRLELPADSQQVVRPNFSLLHFHVVTVARIAYGTGITCVF